MSVGGGPETSVQLLFVIERFNPSESTRGWATTAHVYVVNPPGDANAERNALLLAKTRLERLRSYARDRKPGNQYRLVRSVTVTGNEETVVDG